MIQIYLSATCATPQKKYLKVKILLKSANLKMKVRNYKLNTFSGVYPQSVYLNEPMDQDKTVT